LRHESRLQKQLLTFAFEGRGSLQRNLLGIEREPGRFPSAAMIVIAVPIDRAQVERTVFAFATCGYGVAVGGS
jgi:hypothetical protein